MTKSINNQARIILTIGFIISTFYLPISAQSWNMIGTDINGEILDQLGYTLDLSDDGTMLAVGSPTHTKTVNGNFEYEKGNVKTYIKSGNNWNQIGNEIIGENNYDQFGTSVSISSDGKTIASGSPYNDDSGEDAGQLRVFILSGNNWIQKGATINGDASNDNFGRSVSLSADGNTVAVGAPNNDTQAGNAGQVKVFEYNGTSWEQKGSDLYGSSDFDAAGSIVSLNSDGNVIAYGLPFNSEGGNISGQVKIYLWNGSAWVQKGNNIYGEEEKDIAGSAISINADGNVIAIGSPHNSGEFWQTGQVRIFEWDGQSWALKGDSIDGEEAEDKIGTSVNISPNGNSVVVAAQFLGGVGQVKVYDWIDDSWVQRGDTFSGEQFSEDFGASVSISGDRRTLAIGVPDNMDNGILSGKCTSFKWDMPLVLSEDHSDLSISYYPNPFNENLNIDFGKNYKLMNIEIKNIYGQTISNHYFHNERKVSLEINQAAGLYFIVLKTKTETISKIKVIKACL